MGSVPLSVFALSEAEVSRRSFTRSKKQAREKPTPQTDFSRY
ncbi:hypothetical protein COO91_00320 [Nostoc flagelliforme CCNUN1]|uniref:Uncharacterized protein n=1 Tax=Nostoc flagelliforme CCNUN1 TaxID=2038116 RepID=A0A2K8SGD6_9NOSO|nr:hypothetical protein COO91_00320 [Nostoc flagelliforme CCNUN1]